MYNDTRTAEAEADDDDDDDDEEEEEEKGGGAEEVTEAEKSTSEAFAVTLGSLLMAHSATASLFCTGKTMFQKIRNTDGCICTV